MIYVSHTLIIIIIFISEQNRGKEYISNIYQGFFFAIKKEENKHFSQNATGNKLLFSGCRLLIIFSINF